MASGQGGRSVLPSVITREAASCRRWEQIQRQLDNVHSEVRDLGTPSPEPRSSSNPSLGAQETPQKKRQEDTSPLIKETFLCNRQRPLQKKTTNQHEELWSAVPTRKHLGPQYLRLRDDCRRGGRRMNREFSVGSSSKKVRSYTHPPPWSLSNMTDQIWAEPGWPHQTMPTSMTTAEGRSRGLNPTQRTAGNWEMNAASWNNSLPQGGAHWLLTHVKWAGSLENMHIRDTMQTEQVVYLCYLEIHWPPPTTYAYSNN